MENAARAFLVQMLQQSPSLLAYLVAIFVALTFWRRCPTPSLLTVSAAGLLLIIATLQSFLIVYLTGSQAAAGVRADQIHSTLMMIAIASGLLRALAFCLLLAAVFYGRGDSQPPRVEDAETAE